ncbi:unnamed protein product, partial [Iphiclides podalirius]
MIEVKVIRGKCVKALRRGREFGSTARQRRPSWPSELRDVVGTRSRCNSIINGDNTAIGEQRVAPDSNAGRDSFHCPSHRPREAEVPF